MLGGLWGYPCPLKAPEPTVWREPPPNELRAMLSLACVSMEHNLADRGAGSANEAALLGERAVVISTASLSDMTFLTWAAI